MNMLEQLILDSMCGLAKRRPIFHSEADFQLALAWEVQTLRPDARIRLEKRVLRAPPVQLDVLIQIDGIRFGLELKYPRKAIDVWHEDEKFSLAAGAADLERYDFLKDIGRLELLRTEDVIEAGCALLLTNEPKFWNRGDGRVTGFEQFRLHEGRSLSGTLNWEASAGMGTRKTRDEPIVLGVEYSLGWRDYSKFGKTELRFLPVFVS